MRYRFWSVRVRTVQYWRCKTFGLCATDSGPSELQSHSTVGAKASGCALPIPVRQSYSHAVLEVQNLRAVRCQFRSVIVTAVQYWRYKTFGLCAASSDPLATTVRDARLRPRCEHDFFENMEGFGRGVIVLKACLFIRVSKLKESTKNVSVTSQLLAQVYNSWLYSRQR